MTQARLGWFTTGHYLDMQYRRNVEELLSEVVHRLIAIDERLKALEDKIGVEE